jgi:hypothetical protein
MADFDLTQTDQQVQNILNDAQDAMGAGAQTTLTTDYIMLKGTNGRYHKILKDSFTEAVRNVLAGLLVNNDKGTTISQIPAIASGDFGSVTPANLASVLGRLTRNGYGLLLTKGNSAESDLDANEIDCTSLLRMGVGSTNVPSAVNSSGAFMLTLYYSSSYITQVIFVRLGRVYLRDKNNASWSEWKALAFES